MKSSAFLYLEITLSWICHSLFCWSFWVICSPVGIDLLLTLEILRLRELIFLRSHICQSPFNSPNDTLDDTLSWGDGLKRLLQPSHPRSPGSMCAHSALGARSRPLWLWGLICSSSLLLPKNNNNNLEPIRGLRNLCWALALTSSHPTLSPHASFTTPNLQNNATC